MQLIVNLLALSKDGTKMGTAEVKLSEDGIGGLVCLRFWEAGNRKGAFSLSTVIYEPHRSKYCIGYGFGFLNSYVGF